MRTSAPVIAAITVITAIELVGCAKKPVAKEPSPEPEMTAARMNGRVNIAKELRLRCSIQVNDVDRACFGIVKGSVAPGAACTDSAECANDSPSRYVYCEQDGDPLSPTFAQRFCATFNC